LGPRIVPALSCIVVYSMYLDELKPEVPISTRDEEVFRLLVSC
jgi:hypothetical protein